MPLGLSPPDQKVGMDRQLFDVVEDQDQHRIITTLNPVARSALLSVHQKKFLTTLDIVAELVLKSPSSAYSNDVKGRIIEKCILTHLEINMQFNCKWQKIQRTRFLAGKSK
jgi:hypothetical protein